MKNRNAAAKRPLPLQDRQEPNLMPTTASESNKARRGLTRRITPDEDEQEQGHRQHPSLSQQRLSSQTSTGQEDDAISIHSSNDNNDLPESVFSSSNAVASVPAFASAATSATYPLFLPEGTSTEDALRTAVIAQMQSRAGMSMDDQAECFAQVARANAQARADAATTTPHRLNPMAVPFVPAGAGAAAAAAAVAEKEDWKTTQMQLDLLFLKQNKDRMKDVPVIPMPEMLEENGIVLFDYQEQGVRWLVHKERTNTAIPPFYTPRALGNAKDRHWYVCSITGKFHSTRPEPLRHSILADGTCICLTV
jgi:hypothetical protein